MNPHTIIEALADAFQEQHGELFDKYKQALSKSQAEMFAVRASQMFDIFSALRRAAAKLKPLEPEVNVEAMMEKPI